MMITVLKFLDCTEYFACYYEADYGYYYPCTSSNGSMNYVPRDTKAKVGNDQPQQQSQEPFPVVQQEDES